jgi:hypothetical protein
VAVMPVFSEGKWDDLAYEVSPGFLAGFQIEPRIGHFNTWKGNLDD